MTQAMLLLGVEAKRRIRMFNVRGLKLKKSEGQRVATARKGGFNWAVGLVGVYLLTLFPFVVIQQFDLVDKTLKPVSHLLQWGSDAVLCSVSVNVMLAACFILILRGLATVAIDLANQDLARSDWDLEWLVTMPMPRRSLYAVRLLQRAVISNGAWMFTLPIVVAVAWEVGWRWMLPVVVLAVGLPLMVFQACFIVLAETVLRMRLRQDRTRNLQAALTLIGVVLFYVSFSPNLIQGQAAQSLLAAAREHPQALLYLPGSLVVEALCVPAWAGSSAALLCLEALVAAVGTVWWLERFLAQGVVSGGVWETGRSRRAPVRWRPGASWITPIQRKDLTLLSRDRNFLVQALVMPVVLGGAQLWFNPVALHGVMTDPFRAGAAVFGLACFVQMGSAYQVIVREGQALWLLYASPVSLESILWQKARFWAVITTLYAVVAFVVVHLCGLAFRVESLAAIAFVLVGIPIYAVIATCLGVEGTDPLEEVPQRQIRIEYLYLFMIIASIYGVAIVMADWWERIVLCMLTAFLALAMWQKMRDKLPYLLDLLAGPPPQVSLSDGLISAQAFFILQVVLLFIFLAVGLDSTTAVTHAFGWAGAVVYLANRYIFWRKKSQGVPAVFGPGLPQGLGAGIVGGAVAAAFGVFYIHLVGPQPHASVGVWLVVLAVICAPLCEEFIFRGLIYNGLRRTIPTRLAVIGSAALFAALHPPISVLPVFVMALCAAVVYERHRQLAAPMAVHAIYNAVVLAVTFAS